MLWHITSLRATGSEVIYITAYHMINRVWFRLGYNIVECYQRSSKWCYSLVSADVCIIFGDSAVMSLYQIWAFHQHFELLWYCSYVHMSEMLDDRLILSKSLTSFTPQLYCLTGHFCLSHNYYLLACGTRLNCACTHTHTHITNLIINKHALQY